MTQEQHGSVAVITGASSGLGAAVAEGLAGQGWSVVIDGRQPGPLAEEAERLAALGDVTSIVGDVADPDHRRRLAAAVARLGRVDVVVLNASILGPSPQPQLADYPLDVLRAVYEVNTIAPLAILQDLTPWLRAAAAPRVIAVTSDAAVEPYAGWGGYGSSKAALEQLSAIWAAEQPWCRTWTVDPGDLRTRLHQEAFPGEDISDRPHPATVVPAMLALIASDQPSGRVRLAEIERSDDPGGGLRRRSGLRPPRRAGGHGATGGARPGQRRGEAHGRPTAATGRSSTGPSPICRTSSIPGIVLVVNTSATLPAALDARLPDGTAAEVHLSGRLAERGCGWSSCATVEGPAVDPLARRPRRDGARPSRRRAGSPAPAAAAPAPATVPSGCGLPPWPCRCRCCPTWPATAGRSVTATSRRDRPIAAYQTVFADEPG